MEQLPRYVVQGETTQVYHPHRALYGLKQSPRAWFEKFSQLILSRGLTPCEVNPTIFRTSTSTGCIILTIYADDILATRSDIIGIAQIKAYLHRHLTIQDLGTPNYLGLLSKSSPNSQILSKSIPNSRILQI